MPKLNRFEWLKVVLQSADLNSSTKAVASALSVQFANDKTGQLNPSLKTLDEFLAGMSLATIKRCLRQLVEFGWLFRSEGRGAGNHTEYVLRAPGKIIPFRTKKKRAPVSLSKTEKGSSVTTKGCMGDLSYIEKKQSKEQNASLRQAASGFCEISLQKNGFDAAVFVPKTSFGCRQWEAFVQKMFGDFIDRVVPIAVQNGKQGFWLPGRFPPINEGDWPTLRTYMDPRNCAHPTSARELITDVV